MRSLFCQAGMRTASVKSVASVNFQPVAHGGAENVGDEQRHATAALPEKPAAGVDDPDSVVLVFVDERTVGGAGDVEVNLIGDRNQPSPDNFDRDGVTVAARVFGLNYRNQFESP